MQACVININDCSLQVDCIVTTAGGIEEDFIKCLAPTYIGDFHLEGKKLREKGINRIGNLLVPNDNYCLFEDWVMPLLDKMLEEQKQKVCFHYVFFRYFLICYNEEPVRKIFV